MAPEPRVADGIARDEFAARAERARASLRACNWCEHRCGADRTLPAAELARTPCGLGVGSSSYKRHVSFAEELDLVPSYMVYLSGCNLRCRFCVQGPTCFSPVAGEPVDVEALARECEAVVARGAKVINVLGGEPSIHLHTLLELAAAAESPLPIALNSNMYMTPEVLEALDGVVAVYVADLKFGDDECARRIAGVERYVETVRRNLLAAARQAPVIVRHLLMPGHFDCCFVPTVEWLAAHLPDAAFTLMTSYVPAWRAARDGSELGRTTTVDEAERAARLVESLGLKRSE
ncbi:MAG: radical SAM protein [Phycisphaerales bacterium]